MVRTLRGTKAAGYADGLLEISRRDAAAVVRTAVNHTGNYAREALYAENADIVSKVQWHSTLDGRTCPQCAGLDGKTFELGKGPRPPAHYGCRRSEEHTSELQSLMRISYAVFCLKKKK